MSPEIESSAEKCWQRVWLARTRVVRRTEQRNQKRLVFPLHVSYALGLKTRGGGDDNNSDYDDNNSRYLYPLK